jgi:hypothetical protein
VVLARGGVLGDEVAAPGAACAGQPGRRAGLGGASICAGQPANTITCKQAVFHGALGYAVELGLLPANPVGLVRWHGPKAASAVSPATVPSPAQVRAILAATALARRPGDLRRAALSPWLNATGDPAEAAARAGNSARVPYEVYLHCTDGQQGAVSQRIEDALAAAVDTTHPPPHAKASGYTHRRLPRDPVRLPASLR